MFTLLSSQHYSHSPQGYYPTFSPYGRYQARHYLREPAYQRVLRHHCHTSAFTAPGHNLHCGSAYPAEILFFEELLRRYQTEQGFGHTHREKFCALQDEFTPEQYNIALGNPCTLRPHLHVRRAPVQLERGYNDITPMAGLRRPETMPCAFHQEQSSYFQSPQALDTIHNKQCRTGFDSLVSAMARNHEHTNPALCKYPMPRTAGSVSTFSAPPSVSATQSATDFVELLLRLFSTYYSGYQQGPAATATQSTSATHVSDPVVPGPSAAQPGHTAEQGERSLMATLESRLSSEYEAEIRDTIQAILESLEQPSASTTSVTERGSGIDVDVKGKSKAIPIAEENVAQKIPSPSDITHVIDTLTNIETSFRVLMEDFDPKILLNLTFTAHPSHIVDDGHSDVTTSSTSRLAYTPRNGPVRFYTHSLHGILEQLDAVESYGNDELRSMRKEIVGRVEAALDDIENEVGIRLRIHEQSKQEGNCNTRNEPNSAVGQREQPSQAGPITPQANLVEETTTAATLVPSDLPPFEEKVTVPAIVSSLPTTIDLETHSVPMGGDKSAPISPTPSEEKRAQPGSVAGIMDSELAILADGSRLSSLSVTQVSDTELSSSHVPQERQAGAGIATQELTEDGSSIDMPESGFGHEDGDLSEPFLSAAYSELEQNQSKPNTLDTSSGEDQVDAVSYHSDWSEVDV